MMKINKVVITACLLLVVQLALFAQNNTNSPYSRYGYGELADRSFGAGRAMGGVGVGLRSSKQINPMNPASYSAMDSLTFLFDFGASAQLAKYDDGVNKQNYTNGNIEYLAMQFPISDRLAMSLGILPYSFVGYDYKVESLDGDAPFLNRYTGKGGFNNIYAGFGYDLWKNRLALGANVGYFFGNLEHASNVYLVSSTADMVKSEKLHVRDVKLDLGLQYTHPIGKQERFVLGLTYSPSKDLNMSTYRNTIQYVGNTSNVVESDTSYNSAFGLPNSYGVGFSYIKDNRLTVAADFLYEDWASSKYYDRKGSFKDRFRVGGGAEYTPRFMDRSLFKRINYRAGVHYGNSYHQITASASDVNLNNASYKEFGASVGLGLPLVDGRSHLNIAFEYTKITPSVSTMIDEQYYRFTISYTFNERWFSKFKLD
jgi:hypothetical protein